MRRRASVGFVLALAALGTGCGTVIGAGAYFGWTNLIDKKNNTTPPIPQPVSVTPPVTLQFDRVPISFSLTDPSITSFDVLVEYSTAGTDGPFQKATEAPTSPSEGTSNLSASQAGNPHLFVWNSFFDLDRAGIRQSTDIAVRVTAMLPGSATPYGLPGSSKTFTVDNRLIATVAGSTATGGEGIPGVQLPLFGPEAAVVGSGDNVYVADTRNARLRILDATTNLVRTFAGSSIGFGGDGFPAVSAQLSQPRGLAFDATGNLFIADSANNRIRRIDAVTGLVSTIAGMGSNGYAGDGAPATAAKLSAPRGVAVTPSGDIYVCDSGNHAVRLIQGGVIRTVAGTGLPGSTGDGGPALAAQLSSPTSVWVDGQDILVADTGNHAIRSFNVGGAIATIAGLVGTSGLGGEDETATASKLASPGAVCRVGDFLYVSDTGNNRIRRFKRGSTIATVAGGLDGKASFAGDNGPAAAARFNGPLGVAPDGAGGVLVADTGNNRIRDLTVDGRVTTIMGSGALDATNVGDGGPATDAFWLLPSQMVRAADGSILVADQGTNRIRRFSPNGTIATLAGGVNPGFTGDGGLAANATLNQPVGVTIDQNGLIFIGDTQNLRIRVVNPATGLINTVAGGGSGPDATPATTTRLTAPGAMLPLPGGPPFKLLVADSNRIRQLTYTLDAAGNVNIPTAGIATVCGTGTTGFNGDGVATATRLSSVVGFDQDSVGNIYFRDQAGACVRRFTVGGNVVTVCGQPTSPGFSGDGGSPLAAQVNCFSVGIDRTTDTIYLSDVKNNRIRRFQDPTLFGGATIDTIVGTGSALDAGIGGPALGASFALPSGIFVDPTDGSLVFNAQGTRRIYRVSAPVVGGTISVTSGRPSSASFGDGGSAIAAFVNQPVPTVDFNGNVYMSERTIARVRRVDARTGLMSTTTGIGVDGIAGLNGPAANAQIGSLFFGLAPDANNNLILPVRDFGYVLKIDTSTSTIFPIAGTGTPAPPGGTGDNGPATQAGLEGTFDLAVSPRTGNIYLAERTRVRMIDASGTITTIAGGGVSTADNIPATQCLLGGVNIPTNIAVDGNERIYLGLFSNHIVRTFTQGGNITTVAGIAATPGYNGDGIPARQALLNNPRGLAVDSLGNLYIADNLNNRIRKVDPQGFISTVAGTGDPGSGPDGVPAFLSKINGPNHVVVDRNGNLYVGELFGNRVRRFRVFQ